MNRIWRWETKRLDSHRYVGRPWRRLQDRRAQAVAAALTGGAAVVGAWHLQGAESGPAAHGTAAGLTAALVLWGCRAWRR